MKSMSYIGSSLVGLAAGLALACDPPGGRCPCGAAWGLQAGCAGYNSVKQCQNCCLNYPGFGCSSGEIESRIEACQTACIRWQIAPAPSIGFH
ncbi:MAG: hypothetical protein KF864_04400 [Phycisphaeraceae bacterium]|nr:hypothetical protein [Phycisphaeraceae bacterium]MBX3410336.1 hypothetical protein [Phycisphaeraceae bacterium]